MAKANLTTTAQIDMSAREVDFVTRFGRNWQALMDIMGIMRPIEKMPGTILRSYKAEVDGTYQSADVGEGEEIPYTKFKVVESRHDDIAIKKFAKAVTLEAVAKYGAEVAVEKTDEEFLYVLQNYVMMSFYAKMTNIGNENKVTVDNFQMALAMAKAEVLEAFANMDRTVTEVVGFASILDAYKWLGTQQITVQTQFGISYIENFMGYKTLFLLPEKYIESGKVYAVPVENLNLYYIDPANSDFSKLGLEYRTDGETNLIGFHANGDYSHAVGENFAIIGMTLWAEYDDGIVCADFGASPTAEG